MAEIHIEKKPSGMRWIWILLLLLVAAAAGWYFYTQRDTAPNTPGTVGAHAPAGAPESRSPIWRG